MLDAQTGYVRLQDFAENTDRDLGRALAELREKGMKRLVLDIRNNPGGPLDQAIRVANRFLKKGDLIVYTRGRVPNSDQDFRATEESDYTDLPMVVLTNRNSASASEIVSGALQDHDRALIVGETTFGKALVQSIYRISQGAGLARRRPDYTPSGRLIQRPWDGTFDEYLSYTLKDQDDQRPHDAKDLKYTDSGRRVTAVAASSRQSSRRADRRVQPVALRRTLSARQLFSGYAQRSAAGDTRPGAAGKDRKFVGPTFTVDDGMEADFKKYVAGTGLKIDEAKWTADQAFIRAMIRYDIDLALFGVSNARRHLLETDPQAQLAISLFKEAEQLTQLSRAKSARLNQ
jgi:carboxyl-terminal processing protease